MKFDPSFRFAIIAAVVAFRKSWIFKQKIVIVIKIDFALGVEMDSILY